MIQSALELFDNLKGFVRQLIIASGLVDANSVSDGAMAALLLGALLPVLVWVMFGPRRQRQFARGRRVALVVGAAGGIGSCTAKRLAKEGFFVVLADLAKEPLASLAAEIGSSNCSAVPTNITSSESVQHLVEHIAQHACQDDSPPASQPRLDLVVLAAGAAREGLFDVVPTKAHLLALDVNAGGMVRVLQSAQPLLMNTVNSAVITVGSATCHPWAMPEYGGYAMSKAAQRALTEILAIEWAHYGVSVCDVIPPAVDTPFVTGQSTPASIHGHFMTARVSPDSVAAGIVREALYPSGNVHVALDAGVLALGVLSGILPCLKVPLVRFLGQPRATEQDKAGQAVLGRLPELVQSSAPAAREGARSRSQQRSS